MKTLIAGILLVFSLTAATPDCQKMYHFSNRAGDIGVYGQEFVPIVTATGGGFSSSFNNTIPQCTSWSVSYSSEGLSALSLQFEDAPNSYSGGNTAGTFVAFAGTAVTGSNPMSTTTSNYYTGTGYFPWERINLVSFTGTGSIDVVMQGWKSPVFVGSILNGQPIAIPSSSTATTQAANDNSTKVATTAYADRILKDSGPITITAAQVNASSVTTINIVPAQGAGTLIIPVNCFVEAVFGSAAFTGGGAISLQYASNATTPNRQATISIASTFLTSFSASQYIMIGPLGNVGTSATPINEGIYFFSGGVFASGTGASVVVDCKYYVQSGVV